MERPFSYRDFTTRNIGFFSEPEQDKLKQARIFVPGVGGMGGTVVACLARSGVSNFIISDIDQFEISNLNRQIFCTINVIGEVKAKVTREEVLKINPEAKVEVLDGSWPGQLDSILPTVDLVINGTDDIKSTIHLMRKCKQYQIPVIDAFASPLPNVYVVRPNDRRPEEEFGFPTQCIPVENITKEMESRCFQKEIEHIVSNSSSMRHFDLKIALEIMAGKRKRSSIAPMVWVTGCLMAYEAIRLLLKKPGGPGIRGIFFNPWTLTVERPKNFIVASLRKFVARAIGKPVKTVLPDEELS